MHFNNAIFHWNTLLAHSINHVVCNQVKIAYKNEMKNASDQSTLTHMKWFPATLKDIWDIVSLLQSTIQ